MKKTLILFAMFCYGFITAQIKTPQPSPTATITQKVGISNISVEYSRPGAKEREIFGGLVSYEKMWRTGANKATKITFDENCVFGGAKIKKGSYSLFTIPSITIFLIGKFVMHYVKAREQKLKYILMIVKIFRICRT